MFLFLKRCCNSRFISNCCYNSIMTNRRMSLLLVINHRFILLSLLEIEHFSFIHESLIVCVNSRRVSRSIWLCRKFWILGHFCFNFHLLLNWSWTLAWLFKIVILHILFGSWKILFIFYFSKLSNILRIDLILHNFLNEILVEHIGELLLLLLRIWHFDLSSHFLQLKEVLLVLILN